MRLWREGERKKEGEGEDKPRTLPLLWSEGGFSRDSGIHALFG